MSTRVVVTGASGFVGRHLLASLQGRDVEVIGVGRRAAPGLHTVASYIDTPEGDVLIHLAEHSVRAAAQDAGPAYAQEALRTVTVLNRRFRRVVYASSGALYGDRFERPCRPDDALRVDDVYTSVKVKCEQEVLTRRHAVARLSNLYGPGMSERNVVSTILAQMHRDGAVEVMDDSPVRDFLWVEDAADALALMALGSHSGIYNVGSGQGTPIRALALLTLELAGQSGRAVVSRLPPSKPPSRLVLDRSATSSDFGWHPRVTLPAGIRTLLDLSPSRLSRHDS